MKEARFIKQSEHLNRDSERGNSHLEDAIISVDDGTRLAAEIVHSATSFPSRGVLVFVHGFGGNKHENGLFRELANHVSTNGFDSVLYDWRGIGQSEGEFHSTPLSKHVEDFDQVAQWAQKRFPDSDSLSAVGFSLGAAVVGLALRDDTAMNRVAYISPAVRPRLSMWPRYDNPELRRKIEEQGFAEKPGSSVLLGLPILDSLRDTDLGTHAFDVDVPLLVVHGTEDSRVDCSYSRELVAEKELLENFRYIEFDGASHSFRPAEVYWRRLASEISNWFSVPDKVA